MEESTDWRDLPYFRIFSPDLTALKLDKSIREFCKEVPLAGLPCPAKASDDELLSFADLCDTSIPAHSPKWNDLHEMMITGSSVASIMGVGYDENACIMYQHVMGRKSHKQKQPYGAAIRYGIEHEKDALAALRPARATIMQCGMIIAELPDTRTPKSTEWYKIGYTPDGVTAQLELCEVKCPYSRAYAFPMPVKYYLQIQTGLMIFERMNIPLKQAIYAEWRPNEELKVVVIQPDWATHAMIQQSVSDFYAAVKYFKNNKPAWHNYVVQNRLGPILGFLPPVAVTLPVSTPPVSIPSLLPPMRTVKKKHLIEEVVKEKADKMRRIANINTALHDAADLLDGLSKRVEDVKSQLLDCVQMFEEHKKLDVQ